MWLLSVLQLIKSEVEKEQLEADIRAEVQEEMQQLIEQAVAKERAKVAKAEEEEANWRQKVTTLHQHICSSCSGCLTQTGQAYVHACGLLADCFASQAMLMKKKAIAECAPALCWLFRLMNSSSSWSGKQHSYSSMRASKSS